MSNSSEKLDQLEKAKALKRKYFEIIDGLFERNNIQAEYEFFDTPQFQDENKMFTIQRYKSARRKLIEDQLKQKQLKLCYSYCKLLDPLARDSEIINRALMRGKFTLKCKKDADNAQVIEEFVQEPLAFYIHKARHFIDKVIKKENNIVKSLSPRGKKGSRRQIRSPFSSLQNKAQQLNLPKKIRSIASNLRINPKRKKITKKFKGPKSPDLGTQFELTINVRDEADPLAILNSPAKEHKFSNLNVFGGENRQNQSRAGMNKKKSGPDYSLKTQNNNDLFPRHLDSSQTPRNNIKIGKFEGPNQYNLEKKITREISKKLHIDTSDNIVKNNFMANSPPKSPNFSNFHSEDRSARMYYLNKKDDIKKKLFRIGSNKFIGNSSATEEDQPPVGFLNIEDKAVEKNVIACKLPVTSHISSRRRIRKESESTRKEIKACNNFKTRKVNQKLRTIVQKCDDIVQDEPCSSVFEGIEYNIIKEQFMTNKRNYLSQLLQKYDDTPIDSNNMLVKLIQELTSEKYNDDRNKDEVVKEYKISQMPSKFIRNKTLI
ncbi:unnamed protein product [Moneuplotes crassus]|uniref:Uncharacterized protein n=1 Tax=Euplotes crassus TaxID=5936 RepID=A0AAD1X5Q1_EUPCR|nr:unnamed protein product [Moneuplotes crassus]